MSDYHFNETVTIPLERVERWSENVYLAAGMQGDAAKVTAHIQAVTDARGVYSHGIQRCPTYVARLRRGATDPLGRPEIVGDAGAFTMVDGHNAMGQVAASYAMRVAISKAREFGSSTVALRGSNHVGAMAYYAMMAAEEGMIGISMTQGAGNALAPWGGRERLLGNNPFAYAIPAQRYPTVVLDMAQSVVAAGKLDIAKTTHSMIPDTWALDRAGKPTTDPNEFYTLQPIGGYKGYGLSVILTLLCAVLPDVPYGHDLVDLMSDSAQPQNGGQLFQVINVGKLMDAEAFRQRVDAAIDCIKGSEKQEGVMEILMPGEPEARNFARQSAEGIRYPAELIAKLAEFSRELGVEPLL